MADSRLTDLTAQSVLATDDVLYSVDVSDTTDNAAGSSRKLPIDRLLGFQGLTPGGRLTLESGVSISTSNQTAKSTLYYTPHFHDWVRLYDGTRPKLYQFTERSLSLTVTSGKNYDVFLYDNAGTLTLELSAAWTNDTTRADALAWQAGVGWVKSGTSTRLHLGTIRASGTNQTEQSFATTDAPVRQFVWNRYNQIEMALYCHDSTDSWNYTTATWRQKRGSANNQIEWVCGDNGGSLTTFDNYALAINASAIAAYQCGVGIDSKTSIAAESVTGMSFLNNNTQAGPMTAAYRKRSSLGYHYAAALEQSSAAGTTTWYGDAGNSATYKYALTGIITC